MKIKKKERKYLYPILLFIPTVFTFVFVKDKGTGENEWIKWSVLVISWIIAFALIIWAEIEIRKGKKKK